MINKYSVIFFTMVILIFTSCVSKKKFVEMQSGRLSAEDKVRQLTEQNEKKAARIESMITDFETMKNELLINNAIKDNYIDSLNNVMFELNNQLQLKQESLKETSFTLDFEKQRLTETLENRDITIERLKTQVEMLENDITDRSSQIEQKNYDINLLKQKLEGLQVEYESEKNRLFSEITMIKRDLDKLRPQLKQKNDSITLLKNNVKLLKKELGQN